MHDNTAIEQSEISIYNTADSSTLSPEQQLCCALILSAILEYNHRNTTFREIAREWLHSDDDTTPYSYLWCLSRIPTIPDDTHHLILRRAENQRPLNRR